MPKSGDQENLRLRKENAQQREDMLALRLQLTEVNRITSELTEQLKLSLQGNRELNHQLKDLRNKLDILLQQQKKSKNREFGSKTEKHNPRPALTAQPRPPKSKPATPKDRNHEKHIHSQNLPIEHVHHYVDADKKICPTCLVDTVRVSDQISHQLERITSTLKKLEHLQEVRSCPKCRHYIVTAEKPASPIPGSYVGPRLLAYTIVAKFAYGLPLYRQSKIFKHERATIPRSTQCDWTLAGARLLEPVWELMKLEVQKSKVIQTDDTQIKIQAGGRNGNMRKGKMTPHIGDKAHPYIVFDFSPDLTFARNKAFYANYTGMIQADAANGMDALYKDSSRIEVGCSAHSRRKYYEYTLSDPDDPDCQAVLDIYRDLYIIESIIANKSAAERLAARRKQSKPLIKKLRKVLIGLQGKFQPTNGLMEAVSYTLNHWLALTRFLKDPDLNIDNNACERAIKAFVLTRKNFLFVGSDEGGRAAAILLSFIATCDMQGIDPIAYLSDVFSRMNSMKVRDLPSLLPDRWAQAQKQKKVS